MTEREIEAHSTKCLSCGDNMVFSPEAKALVCSSCKQVRQIEVNTAVNKHAVVENGQINADKNASWVEKQKVMACANCGANVVLQDYDTSATCPYCDSHLIARREEVDGLSPDGIIPFAFGRERAHELFKAKIKNKWFAPRALKKKISADQIHSYYFPAFVFEASCQSSYHGTLYENYTRRDRDGRTVTERRYFRISGNQDTTHSGIEVEASTKLTQAELSLVRPYNFKKATGYAKEYVAGYSQECHSNSVQESYPKAREIIKNEIKNIVLSKYSYDGVQSFTLNTNFINPKFSYYILPMYRINFTYKKKQYSNVMNGQTGALGGKTPKSGLKITFVVLLAIAIFLLPILLIALTN